MATTFLEPGGDATFNVTTNNNSGGLWSTIQASSSLVASDFVHGNHKKSIQYHPSGLDICVANSVIADSGGRFSFYIYLVALPAANASIISAGTPFKIRLSTAGVIQLWNQTPAQIGTDGSTLSTGRWYRISLSYTITSTTINRFELFVDGVSSISITNATIGSTGTANFTVGNIDTDTSLNFRSSDHYIDDSNSLTDTGDIWVTAKRPNANGNTNGFTTQIGSGSSGYGSGHSPQVNERAVSTTNGWSMIGAGSAITEEYNIENSSTGDINISSDTLVDFMGWVFASSLSSETGSIILAGVSSNISLTSSAKVFTKMAGSTTYPAGGTDIGIITTTALTTVSLYECGVIIAYIPIKHILTDTEGINDKLNTMLGGNSSGQFKDYNEIGLAYNDINTKYSAARIIYSDTATTYNQSSMRYDGILNGMAFVKSLVDAEGITDTTVRSWGFGRPISDQEGITDSSQRTYSGSRKIADSEGLTDSDSRVSNYVRGLVDTLGMTDLRNATRILLSSLQDTLGLTDSIKPGWIFARNTLDQEGITDLISKNSSFSRATLDTLGMTDNLARVINYFRSLLDTEGLTDSLKTQASRLVNLSDSMGVTDSISKTSGVQRSLADQLGLSDNLTHILTILRSLIDSEGLTDQINFIRQFNRALSDNLGITDIIAFQNVLYRVLADVEGMTDSLTQLFKELGISVAKFYGIENVKPVMEAIANNVPAQLIVESLRPSNLIDRDAGVGVTTTPTTYSSSTTTYNSSLQVYGGANPSRTIYNLLSSIENIRPQMFAVART